MSKLPQRKSSGGSRPPSPGIEHSSTSRTFQASSGTSQASSGRSSRSSPPVRRRAPSPSDTARNEVLANAKKRVDKVLRARLYLLRRVGQRVFIVTSDSPNHKYRVTIGAQVQTLLSCFISLTNYDIPSRRHSKIIANYL